MQCSGKHTQMKQFHSKSIWQNQVRLYSLLTMILEETVLLISIKTLPTTGSPMAANTQAGIKDALIATMALTFQEKEIKSMLIILKPVNGFNTQSQRIKLR